jgi:rfaE bifunctional protein kinase chain/domain
VALNIDSLFDAFTGKKVLVIGDVMIDAYLFGSVDRISPEAPVPVVNVARKENRLGGAANVALNLLSLGANPIICTVIGHDRQGTELSELMVQQQMSTEGLVRSNARITTVKTRVISHAQQMLRIDEEQTNDITASEEQILIDRVAFLLKRGDVGVIVFEDYNKGVLTEKVITEVILLAQKHQVPTCVDPKKKNFFAYKGVTLFKPNLKELREGLKMDIDRQRDDQLFAAVEELESRLQHKISLVTLSERGVLIKQGSERAIFPAHVRNIADVSGAGDTVIAVASLCLSLNTPIGFLAQLSNLAGGLVCESVGVVPIDRELLLQEAKKELNDYVA